MKKSIKKELINILDIKNAFSNEDDKKLIDRLFDIRIAESKLMYPEDPEIIKTYGEKNEVIKQKIIKITNRITYEGSLFNEIRSSRPYQTKENVDILKEFKKKDNCVFCLPRAYFVTASDPFISDQFTIGDFTNKGRLIRDNCFTASNSGKYEEYHSLVIFKNHDPFTFDLLPDYLNCALDWAGKAHEKDKSAMYFFFMWNCLWKAGGSIIHGHTQMSLTKGMHYGKIEYLLKIFRDYKRGNYFEDLFKAHELFGLGLKKGKVMIMSYLTPIKEKEIFIVSESIDELGPIVGKILKIFYKEFGVRSFNLALIVSPTAVFNDVDIEEAKRWNGFPVIARIVDRGDLMNRTADIGAMELYANSVISSDPFTVAAKLKEFLIFDEDY